jgi:predicted RNase H-like HicB family nuclease
MKNYIALFEETGKGGYSAVFPDVPGCFSAGDNYEETYKMAHEALAFHIDCLIKDGEKVPQPRTLEQIKKKWEDWKEWEKNYKFMPVPIALIPLAKKAKRVNLMIPESLLTRIDSIATNRSEFVSNAIEQVLNHSLYKNHTKKGR